MSAEASDDVLPPVNITWTTVSADDLLSGLGTLNGIRQAVGRIISPSGEQVKTYLTWARAELKEAEKGTASQKRHTTQAAGHASRALDRLFSLYIQRDRLEYRAGLRAGFAKKLEIMKLRAAEYLPEYSINWLISRLRNIAEHEYVSPTIEDARLAVENAEMIAEVLQGRSDPRNGPALLGTIGFEYGGGPSGEYVRFTGFHSPFAMMWQDATQDARIGVGIPSSRHEAEVRHCKLKELNLNEHLSILESWAARSPPYYGEAIIDRLLQLAGLDGPR